MAWRTEKTDSGKDLVYDGVEVGIAASPTKGNANLQNVNIATETGEALVSYARTPSYVVTPTITGGTLTASGGAGTELLAAPANLAPGMWINITASTITTIPARTTVNALVVGGGGGGGKPSHLTGFPAAGGGAGGYISDTSHTVTNGAAYAVVVGAGGSGATNVSTEGGNGSNSSFDTLTAIGGGGGAGDSSASPTNNGRDGGSGGGGCGSGTGGLATSGQGSNGGDGSATGNGGGGGGGGASAAGGNASGTGFGSGGAGGAGTANSISGASVTYAGGGGGGAFTTGAAGAGGAGGGGAGAVNTNNGTAGTANTGGGGGAGGQGAGGEGNGGNGGSGVVIIAYPTAAMTATGGTITTSGSNTIHTFTSNGTFTVTAITGTTLSGHYYVSYKNGSSQVKISSIYDPTVSYAIVHGTTGTATFDTLVYNIGSPIAKATEKYNDGTSNQYRYYVLDSNSYVWVYDTAVYAATLASSGVGTTWVLPDLTSYSTFTGIAVLNGWLVALPRIVVSGSNTTYVITAKPTCDLGRAFANLAVPAILNSPFPGKTNFAYVGHQGVLYYTDANYLGSIFPNTSLVTNVANIQSYAQYTSTTTEGTITKLFEGSIPLTFNDSGSSVRIPVTFFTDQGGVLPSAISADTVYYISSQGGTGFEVFAASTGGSAINITTGAIGNQFYNTFYPYGDLAAGGSAPTVEVNSQRLNLPPFEVAQCIIEIGNTIIIGCAGNTLYPWNQIDPTPSNLITLPESNVRTMINVNNVAYVFAGNKGNIYITNLSVASLVTKVPDYCAGVPGTPSTYIEPYFTWGDSMYLRGRVYFSILDQTATKAGNCGGVWSFIPSQNADISQDVGIALRLENQNSYGSYNGHATILIANEDQLAVSPQYFSGWQNSYSIATSTFGIDTTGTTPVTTAVIETDLIPTGTMLDKETFAQVEFKLTTPMQTGDSVTPYWRLNSTDAWSDSMNVNTETGNAISGYADINFQKTQWIQFRLVLNTNGSTSSSFMRFKELRLRKHE